MRSRLSNDRQAFTLILKCFNLDCWHKDASAPAVLSMQTPAKLAFFVNAAEEAAAEPASYKV